MVQRLSAVFVLPFPPFVLISTLFVPLLDEISLLIDLPYVLVMKELIKGPSYFLAEQPLPFIKN